MKLLFLPLFVCLSFTSFSQTIFKGVVKDQNDSLLLGNILILSPADSSLIKGFHFDYGVFSINYDKPEAILLKVRSYGLDDKFIPINADELGGEVDLGLIKMESSVSELDGVEVVAYVPLFRSSPQGGLIVNVEKTMLSSSSSIFEVLSKTPNVIVGENNITVVGKGEALIYLNGKQIPFERLGTISVQTIKEVEIISNPSAKYDAAGRAVVNIITKINRSEGFDVSIMQNFIFAKHFLSASSIGLNYRKGKFSVRADYAVTLGKDWSVNKTIRTFDSPSGTYRSEGTIEENTRLTNLSNYQLGIGYEINPNNYISLEYAGLFNIYDLSIDGDNVITNPDASITSIDVFNNGGTDNLNNSFSLNYDISNLDTLGSSLFIGGQYSMFKNELNDLIFEETSTNGISSSSGYRNNRGRNNISLLTAQTDYNKIFKNGTSLELGGKFSNVENSGVVDFLSKNNIDDEYQVVPEFSNDFVYHEMVPALYSQYLGKIKRNINYSIGARAEYTVSEGVSNVLNQKVIDTSYLNIFPNASIQMKLSKNWSTGLSYSARITRPQYQDLDPFVWYQDSLTSVQGNPFLIPELTSAYEGVINFKEYSLKLGFNDTKNPILYIALPGDVGENSSVLKKLNLQKKYSYFSSLTLPFEVKFWKSFNTVSLTYNLLKDDRPEYSIGASQPQLYLYSFHRFKVKNWFGIELMAEYEGAQDDGIFFREERFSLSVGLAKFMMDGNLSIRFLANDVLQTYRETLDYKAGPTTIRIDRELNTNFYRLSITYYLGKLRNIKYRNKHTGAEDMDRVNY